MSDINSRHSDLVKRLQEIERQSERDISTEYDNIVRYKEITNKLIRNDMTLLSEHNIPQYPVTVIYKVKPYNPAHRVAMGVMEFVNPEKSFDLNQEQKIRVLTDYVFEMIFEPPYNQQVYTDICFVLIDCFSNRVRGSVIIEYGTVNALSDEGRVVQLTRVPFYNKSIFKLQTNQGSISSE